MPILAIDAAASPQAPPPTIIKRGWVIIAGTLLLIGTSLYRVGASIRASACVDSVTSEAYLMRSAHPGAKSLIWLDGSGLMGQGGFSGRSGAPGDVWYRSSVATHPKSLIGPPQAGFGDALASLRILPDGTTSRGDARLARAPLKPVKPFPSGQTRL
jgi:hypothetical protein